MDDELYYPLERCKKCKFVFDFESDYKGDGRCPECGEILNPCYYCGQFADSDEGVYKGNPSRNEPHDLWLCQKCYDACNCYYNDDGTIDVIDPKCLRHGTDLT